MIFYELVLPDLPARIEAWLFYERSTEAPRRPEVRTEYRDLVCRKCGRFDELAALDRGLSKGVKVPPIRRDAIPTNDGFVLVSTRAREVLLSVPGLTVRFFEIPSSNYFVIYPDRLFVAPPNARLYTPIEPPQPGDAFQVRGRPCRKCGRIRAMTFWLHWFDVPEDVVLVGAQIECRTPAWICWIASQAVVDAIKANRLTGWIIRRTDADSEIRWPAS